MIKVQIRNLSKKYNKIKVLDIDELHVKKGEILSIIGNNGAGKTTTLRLMLDLIRASSGSIVYNETDIVAKTEKWKEYVGAFLDNDFLIDFLTPEEYFYFIGKLNLMEKDDVLLELEKYRKFFNDEILNKKKLIRDLSSGNKQKVGIIGAILKNPDIIILDEPYNMIDPSSKFLLNDLLQNQNKKYKSTIFISSNILDPVINLSTRIILLEKGKIVNDKKVSDKYVKELKNYFSNNSQPVF